MPLIAYQRLHGWTDYPHHFAFFEALEERGLLDKYDFAIDPYIDPQYCGLLMQRFPQLILTDSVSNGSRLKSFLKRNGLPGAAQAAKLDAKFDAVCEAPGGRIQPMYSGQIGVFWAHPRVKRRAILFHSIEEGTLDEPLSRESVLSADIIITRTDASADVAIAAGVPASKITKACDIVFRRRYATDRYKPGCAVALRLPNRNVPKEYLGELRNILDYFETVPKPIDHVRIEEPMGSEMIRRGYGSQEKGEISMWYDDFMYQPFMARRDAIVSCRLHTTIIALLSGNRAIMQFHIELGTTKLQQFIADLGLDEIPVRGIEHVTRKNIQEFVENPVLISQSAADNAVATARRKVELGLDRFEEWLGTVK